MRPCIATLALVVLAGCQPSAPGGNPPPKPQTSVTVEQVVGKYVLDATPDEVAEAGGLDAMPTLVISADGSWKLKVDDETSSGTYKLEKGVLSLTDADGSGQRFTVSESGYRLDEQGADPSGFVKLPDKP